MNVSSTVVVSGLSPRLSLFDVSKNSNVDARSLGLNFTWLVRSRRRLDVEATR